MVGNDTRRCANVKEASPGSQSRHQFLVEDYKHVEVCVLDAEGKRD